MAILKRALIVLAVLLLIPVVVLAAALFYLTTAQGLSTVASLTSKYASSDDTKIAIGGIEGSFPYDLTLKDVRLGDRKGEWLKLDRARLVWSPRELYSRKLTVNLVDVGHVEVARQPGYEKQADAPSVDPNAPLFPELPIEIRLDKFALADLDLAGPVIGTPARLAASMSAQVRKPSQGVSAEFEVKRIDGATGQIGGRARFVPSTNGIEISLRGSEPAGGLIARMADIPGLPPIDIGIEGAGTLDALRTQMVLTAGDQGKIKGMAEVRKDGKDRRVTIGLDGDVGRIAPPAYAELVDGVTRISAEALVPEEGPIDVIDATVDIPAVRIGARGKVDPKAETLDLSYDLRAGDPARFAKLLPGVKWSSLTALGTAKGPLDHPAVKATIDGGGLSADQGAAETARIEIDVTPNGPLRDEATKVAAVIDATADGVKFADDRLFSFGRKFTLSAKATSDLKGYADVERAEVQLADARASYAGTASPEAIKGRATVSAADLSTLAPLVGQPLAGALDLTSDLDVAFDLSRLVASVNGTGSGLVTGVPQVDALTGGSLAIKGGVTRAGDGSFTFRGFDARGENVTVTADGSATRDRADAKIFAEVADLALVEPRAAGKVTVTADLSGRLDDLGVKASVSLPEGRAMDKPLKDVVVRVDATDVTGETAGTFALSGAIDGRPMTGAGRLSTESSGARRIHGLHIALGSTTVAGDLAVAPGGVATGKLDVQSPDLSEIGALALTELAGALDGDVTLSGEGGVQRVAVKLSGSNIVAPSARLGSLDVDMTVIDPAGKLTIDGTANGSAITAGGQVVDKLSVVAKGAPDGMDVSLDMSGLGSSAAARARVAYAAAETRIDLSRLDLAGGGKTANLNAPARIRLVDGAVAIDAFSLRAGAGGVLDVRGRAGGQLDLTLALRELPLALGNAFTPGLDLAGTAEGDARITGAAATPTADYDIKVAGLSIAKLRDARVPPLAVTSRGRLEGPRVTTDTSVTGAGGLNVQAQGSAPLGDGELDMTVLVRNLPLALANAFQPELGFAGRVEADARVTGPVSAPNGTYRAKVIDFTSVRAKGVAPVSVDAKGELQGRRVTTDAAIAGGGGIRATARGFAPLDKGDVDMTVDIAEIPLEIANAFAPDLGLAGALKGAVKVAGPLEEPRGTYDLTIVNLKTAKAANVPALQVATRGRLEGKTVTTDTSVAGGGGLSLTAKGSVPLGPGQIDMGVAIRELPLSIANAVQPELGLGGVLRGDVRLGGPIEAPRGNYNFKIVDLVAAQAKGLPALQIETRGVLEGPRVTTLTSVKGGGLDLSAQGSAPIGEGDLDMTVAIRELPLKLANAFKPELGLGGALRGQAKIIGPAKAPTGTYDLTVTDLTSTQARGVPALLVAARGGFEPKRVTTDALITGGGGVQAAVRGSAPIGEGDLDVTLGLKSFPLALANVVSPGLGLGGEARGAARLTGPVAAPVGNYELTVTELSSALLKSMPALQIATKGDLQGKRVTIDTSVTGGGGLSVSARGSAPLGEGDLDMGVTIRELPLTVANNFRPELGLGGMLRGDVRLTGPLARPRGAYDVKIADLVATQAKGAPPLQIVARGDLLGERVTTDATVTGQGGVDLAARGSAPIGAGDLDLAIMIRGLPLSLANGFQPELGLGGMLRGDVKLAGPPAKPTGRYDLTVVDLTSAQARQAPPLQIAAKGDLLGDRVTTDTTLTGQGGVSLKAQGSAPLGDGDLDMSVTIRELPLALANGFQPQLGLGGVLRGDVKLDGPVARPLGRYDLTIADLTSAQSRQAPPLQIAARGDLLGGRVTTDTTVTGQGGISLKAQGSAPLGDGDLDMSVMIRELPLALTNGFQPELQLAGALRGDARVTGPVKAPTGLYDLQIADLVSGQARNVAPLRIAAKGRLEGRRITTEAAITGAGGVEVTAQGSAPLDAGDLDMTVAIRKLPLELANAVRPELGLSGALKGSAKLAGPTAAPRGTYDLVVTGLTAAKAQGVAPLQIVSKGALEGRRVTTDTAVTSGAGVSLTAKGFAPLDGGDVDIAVAIRAIPLALANAFQPELGLGGALRGDVRIGGALDAPRGTYDLTVADLTTAKAAGAPALQIAARGALQGDRVTTDASVSGGGVRVTAKGAAPIGAGDLDMAVDVAELPLSLANAFAPDLGLAGALRGTAKVGGTVAAPTGTYDVRISDLTSARAAGVGAIQIVARGDLGGGRFTTDTALTGGGARLTAKGSAPLGDGPLDILVDIPELPLALANAFAPDLGLDGRLVGRAAIAGPVAAPTGDYYFTVTGLTFAQARSVPPLQLLSTGALGGGRVTTDTALTGGGGVQLTAKGSAPLGDGPLDMTVAIRELPLALVNGFRPNLGLAGALRGNAKVEGPVSAPQGTYDFTLADVTAAPAKGVPALRIATKGTLEGKRVTTDTEVTGGGGIHLTAKGSAPLGGGDVDMAVMVREVPLQLANAFKPELGLAGVIRGDAKVVGPVTAPRGTYDLSVDGLVSALAKGVPALQIRTKGALEGERIVTDTEVTGGGGIRLVVKGSAPLGGGDLDMAVTIREVPLALANAFKPDLGLAGVLRGDAKVAGPLTAPRGSYDLAVTGLTAAQAKGVPALEITSKGALEGERVTTDTAVTGGGGINLTAKGSAPIGQGDVDMTVAIREVPLALANAFAPSLGLAGKLRGDVKVAGAVTAPQGTYDLLIENLTAAQAKGVPALRIASKGALEGERVTTDTAVTGGGGVRLTAKGAAPIGSGDLDMAIDIAEVPLSIANAFSPGLGLGGRLAGAAKVRGPIAAPSGSYDLRVTELTAAAAKGVPALQVVSSGGLGGGRVTTDTAVTGGGGIRIAATGSAPLSAAGALDMSLTIRNVPLSLANGFSPGLGANGSLQGEAKIGGTIAAPAGTYSLKVSGLSTEATRGAGVPPAGIDSKGRLDGKRVQTDTVVTAASGLRVTARGSAPLGAGDLDLAVEGRAPLAFLNDTLSVSGDRIDGVASFNVKVGGPTSAPRINGTGGLANASYSNRASGLQLRNMSASIAATGPNIDVRSLQATTRNGGTISGSGRVAVDPARGFPGEINIRAANAEVVGTDIVTAITDADLRMQGPLARRPVVNGTIRTRSVEIQIPDRIPAQYTPLPGVKHRNAPAAVTRQLKVVNAGEVKPGAKDQGFLAALDITVQAENKIFIRGMGMQAEAGGQIKIAGTSANPQPVGDFELRQGRSSITVIGKRLNFTRGKVGFAGDLDPTLDFLAETPAKGITAQVLITGAASRPKIEFTSNPAVPQDEVLSRLLFNKSSGELSPSQAITLAQAVAQYSGVGGGGGGPLEGLRKGLGVDTLDISAGGGVGVGKYISDNIYLGVKQGATPEETGVTVDIDITKNIKATADAGAAGNAAAGVAVEWDY